LCGKKRLELSEGGILESHKGKEQFYYVELLDHLREDHQTTILPASPDLFQQGFSLFSHRADKDWSMTDCISFSLMKERGIHEAFAADQHFEQAGYRILMPVNR
jgi:predicted nucleic acid-binding protein